MLKLESELLQVSLHTPGDGFYMGTRFDGSGVFDSLLFKGIEMCGRWFTDYDPKMHDAVCGPAEEFSPVFMPDGILKIGVGMLKGDDAPYDRFKLYPVVDPGAWTVEEGPAFVRFRHRLDGLYDYSKDIALTGPASFRISHSLTPQIALDTEVYNHNFFTFGKLYVSPSRLLQFPFAPAGNWRAQYSSVGFTGNGILFNRNLEEAESVYCGDLHQTGQDGLPYSFTLKDDGLAVCVCADVPSTHMVFWANHRIACPEPYNRILAAPGETFRWSISYRIQDET